MVPKSTGSQGAKVSFSMDDFAKALEQHDYEFKKGQVVHGKIFSYDTEGVYVDIGAKSLALLPLKEVSARVASKLSENLPLQEEREFLIIREQNDEGQVTLSLRQLDIKRAWDELAEIQKSGQTFQVRVTGSNKGGVTVDANSLRGFIPKSHLLQRDDAKPLPGQFLTVNFLELDRDQEKLVLSERLAYQSAHFGELGVGQLIEGKVVSIKPYGVFVDLNGIIGLLHVKQVSQQFTDALPALFSVGQFVKAMIVDLEEGRGRITLSTKVLENYPGEILEKMVEVMDTAEERSERARKKLLQS